MVSCLSVIRGIFEYSWEHACSLSAVRNQEGPLVGGCFTIVISVRAIASVLYAVQRLSSGGRVCYGSCYITQYR